MDDLPWDTIDEPPGGYQYRTVVECARRPVEVLIDMGAAFSFVPEEVALAVINQAAEDGRLNHPIIPKH